MYVCDMVCGMCCIYVYMWCVCMYVVCMCVCVHMCVCTHTHVLIPSEDIRHPVLSPSALLPCIRSLSELGTHRAGQVDGPVVHQDLLSNAGAQTRVAILGFYVGAWDSGSASCLCGNHPHLLSHLLASWGAAAKSPALRFPGQERLLRVWCPSCPALHHG